jgi:hypothetical protein
MTQWPSLITEAFKGREFESEQKSETLEGLDVW